MISSRIRLIALLLAVSVALSGCGILDTLLFPEDSTAFQDMEYVHPDMDAMEDALAHACAVVQSGDSLVDALEAIYDFYDHYDLFYTSYALADIHYCADLTDIYWEAEYTYCLENASAADAALDELYTTIAASSLREGLESEQYFGAGYFDDYEGESVWDEDFLALLDQESDLQSRYYDLSEEDYTAAIQQEMAQILVDLIRLRQQIATSVGYDSYVDFAYDFYYYRDYTPEEAKTYLLQVGSTLYDSYSKLTGSDVWDRAYSYCGEDETFAYVKDSALTMGGEIEEAFSLLERSGLYDIRYGENKYPASFELYIWNYSAPFVFLSPYLDQTDKLTFAHEFGHFCNDYLCSGSNAGTDIAEVHSQAFEYLSLCYAKEGEALTQYKMADSLCLYMEQAAYALFEQQAYELTGEALTVENLTALYKKIGADFGFDLWDWDAGDFVTVTHFYTDPMYIISYVLSNDLAMQFYQLEQAQPGEGLKLYKRCLRSEDSHILTFAADYALESPFAPGRLEAVAETFKEALGS